MNTKNLMFAAVMTAVMAGPVAIAGNDAPASSAGQAQAAMPASGAPMTQVEMLQRMQDMRRQHMEMMQNNPQGMPAMGPRTGMMNPEMMQQMQDMRQQRMEMMQNAPQGMPPMGPGAGRMSPEMMQQMQAMHRQKMEMMQSCIWRGQDEPGNDAADAGHASSEDGDDAVQCCSHAANGRASA